MCLQIAAATAKSLQSCPTLCDLRDGGPPGSPSLGFSRQEHWSGLPFPFPTRESEVTQSCPTLSDPMDCSLPGSSIHGIFQARVLERGAIAFSADFILGGSKITADGECSHEIKRHLLLGRKVMTNLDSIFKSRDITLPTKFYLVKAMVFPVVMYGCELDCEKS